MKLRLLILLAAALAAAPAAGQTVKSLGYNTTNGFVTYSGTNSLTFTNALQFSTNARAATRTNLGGTTVGNSVFTATNAAAAATAVGLGANNGVTFASAFIGTATDQLEIISEQQDLLTVSYRTNGTVASFIYFEPSQIIFGGPINFNTTNQVATTRTNLGLGATWLTNTDVTNFRTAIGLGATNTVTFSNITASGTLAATGNVTLSGVNNTATAQTADSASSLMTRGLVGQEFANPRNRIQTTYWFGLEGQGYWTTVGTNAVTRQSGMGAGLAGGIYIYASTRIGSNIAGAGLRSFNDVDFGGSPYQFSDGGALTMRARVRKNSVVDRPAFAFLMGSRTATQMWQQNAYGLYFVPQPTNSWASNAVATQHDRISVSNVVWAVNTAGTNGPTEPAWTDLIGSLVTNGSAVYVNAGPHTSNNWVLAIGSTNASGVIMTNTGKVGPTSAARAEAVLKLRTLGTTNTPYTVYGSVENNAGESTEVSLTTTNNDGRAPQFWSRTDETTAANADMQIRYISIDSQFPALQ
jgi:hypothetical protein